MEKLITVLLVGVIVVFSSPYSMLSLVEADKGAWIEQSLVETTDTSYFKEFIFVEEEKMQEAQKLSLDIQQAAMDVETNEIQLGNVIDFTQNREDLALAGTLNLTFESEMTTDTAVHQAATMILFHLELEPTEQNLELYEAAISEAFLNLKDQVDNHWMNIISDPHSKNHTTYTYNMIFLVEKESVLLALPFIFTTELNASKEQVLNLSGNESFHFKVALKGVKMIKII
ncbi:hypothetical protein [Chengkuizengella sediminis]|uniref:hypothetical protein n=1 Tax=Chengkuizengella sediminis TaxID=1885917 RepID=UPI0013898023|nr:hypothetical protein [Chengkuizengella sediminis]NDI34565.1 hypothetical protein [Chengkuizengella sediminis]